MLNSKFNLKKKFEFWYLKETGRGARQNFCINSVFQIFHFTLWVPSCHDKPYSFFLFVFQRRMKTENKIKRINKNIIRSFCGSVLFSQIYALLAILIQLVFVDFYYKETKKPVCLCYTKITITCITSLHENWTLICKRGFFYYRN